MKPFSRDTAFSRCCAVLRTAPSISFVLVLGVCTTLTVLASEKIFRLEGNTTFRGFGPDGRITIQQEPKRFSLLLSDSRWAVRLYADTNQPNGITEVTCDGTNTYVFVPDAGGKTKIGTSLDVFAQSGSVHPGRIKVFREQMGPIWWAYCSSCVIGGSNGPILDFMELMGEGLGSRNKVEVRLAETNSTPNRFGPFEEWLYSLRGAAGAQPAGQAALAHLKPLAFSETNGVVLVNSCSVTKYYRDTVPKDPPKARCEYIIDVKEFSIETQPVTFFPAITQPALIADYRLPYSGEYLARQWLNADERKAVPRTLLAVGVRTSSSIGIKRAIILVLVLLPLILIGFTRLRRASQKSNKAVDQMKVDN